MNIDKEHLLNKSNTFCMYPWIHLFVTPKGDTYPCCSHNLSKPLDNVKNKSLEQIFNTEELKSLRITMLSEVKNKTCELCYKFEESSPYSLRKFGNQNFGHLFDDIVKNTSDTGYVEDFKMKYIDIRFSNICNFKCRTCGAEYSSQWAIEDYAKAKKVNNLPSDAYTILHADQSGRLLDETIKHLDHVEMMYFAGGEPLLSEEHYVLLEELIKRKKTNVLLRYNTNASTIKFKGKDLLELWKFFDKIEVSSSIDHYGERAEWLRHGTNWAEVETNLKMFRRLKNVHFQINTVLSIFNYVTLTDFYRYLVSKKLYNSDDWLHFLVPTSQPEYFSATALPIHLKQQGSEKILSFLEQAKRLKFNSLVSNLETAHHRANAESNWEKNKTQFQNIVKEIDTIRGENMIKVFPELEYLLQ